MNGSSPLKRNSVSREAPGFFKIKGVPLSEHKEGNLNLLSSKGKMQKPDRRNGLCKDFPLEMGGHIINSSSRENPHWATNYRKPLSSRTQGRKGAFIPATHSKPTIATSRNTSTPSKQKNSFHAFNHKISTIDSDGIRRYSTPARHLEDESKTARSPVHSHLISQTPQVRPQSSLHSHLEGSMILRAKQELRKRVEARINPNQSKSHLGTRRESMDEAVPAGDINNYSVNINKRSASVSHALKKLDFRLKTNVDLEEAPKASCVMKNDSRVCYPADLKLAFHDYDISEGDTANKSNLMKVPQRPVVLYDPLLDVKRVVKPPDMEIPAFDKYKQNVAKLMSVPRAFNKKQGQFQFELNERLKDGVFRKSMRQSYEDEQIMKRLLNSIARGNNPPLYKQSPSLRKKKKSSMLLRLAKRSMDTATQILPPDESYNAYHISSPQNASTPKPPKSSLSPYNRTHNIFTPYQQMNNTQSIPRQGGQRQQQQQLANRTGNQSPDATYYRSATEMSNYPTGRPNQYGAAQSHFASRHKASGSMISGTSFVVGETGANKHTVRRNTSIATATTAMTLHSGQECKLSPKEQEQLKLQSVHMGLIQPFQGLNNMKAILNRSAINSPQRRTRWVCCDCSHSFSTMKRKARDEPMQHHTVDGREAAGGGSAMLLQEGGMSTVIGNTFYGKIEEFERKQSVEGTPAYKRFSIPE